MIATLVPSERQNYSSTVLNWDKQKFVPGKGKTKQMKPKKTNQNKPKKEEKEKKKPRMEELENNRKKKVKKEKTKKRVEKELPFRFQLVFF